MRVYSIGTDIETESIRNLKEGLGIDTVSAKSLQIAIVGAGGKTNTAYTLAREFGAAGWKSAVTTTTHMMEDPRHGIILSSEEPLPEELPWGEHPYLMIGREMNPVIAGEPLRKVCGLTERCYKDLCREADVVIVEADGAKRRPFKVPASHEPVIPDHTDVILVVMGLSAVGHPIVDCACRVEELCDMLHCAQDQVLTEEAAALALTEGYLKPLAHAYPGAEIHVILNQADDPIRLSSGRKIVEEIRRMRMCGREIGFFLTTREEEERI